MTPTLPPHDAVPLDPNHEQVVDGAHIALTWEPAAGAERYRVQIALDPAFYEVVFEQDLLADVTTLVVRPHFPEDDRTFFWRVLTGNALGWSEGDRIESFISGRADQVGRFADPDATEPFGPVAALFRAASLEALAEVLPGRQPALEAALGEAEPEGVEAAEIFTTGLILTVAGAIVVAVVLFVLFSAC